METSNGVTASFTAIPGSPFQGIPSSNIVVTDVSGSAALGGFSSLTGNALTNSLSGPWTLKVDFSPDVTSISLLFATAINSDIFHPNHGIFTLSAFENGTPVSSVAASGVTPPGFQHSEGSVSLAGIVFNEVEMSADTPIFVVDNIDVKPVVAVVAPEPASLLLLCSGLAGVAALRRRVAK